MNQGSHLQFGRMELLCRFDLTIWDDNKIFDPSHRCSWHKAGQRPNWGPIQWTRGVISSGWGGGAGPQMELGNHLERKAFAGPCWGHRKYGKDGWQGLPMWWRWCTAVCKTLNANKLSSSLERAGLVPNRDLYVLDLVKCEPYFYAGGNGPIEAEDVQRRAKVVVEIEKWLTVLLCPARGGWRGRGWLKGSSGPSTPHCVANLCAQTRNVDIESTKKLMYGMEGVLVCMGTHVVHDDGSADGKEVMSVIVVDGLVFNVALQRARCIVCWNAERTATNLSALVALVKFCDSDNASEATYLSNFS